MFRWYNNRFYNYILCILYTVYFCWKYFFIPFWPQRSLKMAVCELWSWTAPLYIYYPSCFLLLFLSSMTKVRTVNLKWWGTDSLWNSFWITFQKFSIRMQIECTLKIAFLIIITATSLPSALVRHQLCTVERTIIITNIYYYISFSLHLAKFT